MTKNISQHNETESVHMEQSIHNKTALQISGGKDGPCNQCQWLVQPVYLHGKLFPISYPHTKINSMWIRLTLKKEKKKQNF